MKAVVLVLCLLGVPQLVVAQGGEASPPSFSFQPPGARALGMGSAFLGLADDATAAEVNPAGLIQLSQMEVSAHFRSSDSEQYFTSVFTGEGRAFNATSSTDELSFASFVKPFEDWAVSAYFAQNASVNFSATNAIEERNATLRTNRDLTLDAVGVSFAYRAGEHFAAGLTLRMSQLDVNSQQVTDFPDPQPDDVVSLNNGGEDDLTFILGVLVNPGGKVSLGVVYEEGGEYDVSQSLGGAQGVKSVSVPDVFGIGLAWRPSDRMVVVLDLKDISYADLNPIYQSLIDNFDNVEPLGLSETEFGLGLEYTVPINAGVVLLRGGVINDPDHDGFRDVDTAETMFTAGLGFARSAWQFDVGASFGDKAEDLVASFIYRF